MTHKNYLPAENAEKRRNESKGMPILIFFCVILRVLRAIKKRYMNCVNALIIVKAGVVGVAAVARLWRDKSVDFLYDSCAENFVFAQCFKNGCRDGDHGNRVAHGVENFYGVSFRAVGGDVLLH